MALAVRSESGRHAKSGVLMLSDNIAPVEVLILRINGLQLLLQLLELLEHLLLWLEHLAVWLVLDAVETRGHLSTLFI